MKKKILAVALATIMVVIAVAGATLAYMTDKHEATNTFTVGKVDIKLTEANVVKDDNGDIVANPDGSRNEVGIAYGEISNLYPAQSVCKDPTIENIGTEDAYIAAKIYVSADNAAGLAKADILGLDDEYGNLLATHKFLEGGIAEVTGVPMIGTYTPEGSVALPIYGTTEYAAYQQLETIEGKLYYVFYVFVEGAQAPGYSITLFDAINIPAEWDNEEIAALTGLTIDVEAYAVQANSFDTCLEAMTTAFKDAFKLPVDLYTSPSNN